MKKTASYKIGRIFRLFNFPLDLGPLLPDSGNVDKSEYAMRDEPITMYQYEPFAAEFVRGRLIQCLFNFSLDANKTPQVPTCDAFVKDRGVRILLYVLP